MQLGARLDEARTAEAFLAEYLYCLKQERPELAQITVSIPAYTAIYRQGNAVATGKGPAVVVHGDVGTSLAITEMSSDINIATKE